MSREAMRLALEALEGIHPGNMTPMAEEYWNKAIAALREALAHPPQGPVAIALNTGTKQGVKWLKNVEHGEHLYTSPPASTATSEDVRLARDLLTDEQEMQAFEAAMRFNGFNQPVRSEWGGRSEYTHVRDADRYRGWCMAKEAAHGIE